MSSAFRVSERVKVLAAVSVGRIVTEYFSSNGECDSTATTTRGSRCYCQGPEPTLSATASPPRRPSWIRQSLTWWGIALPLPRVIASNDPDLTLSSGNRQRRAGDEKTLRQLQTDSSTNNKDIPRTVQQLYAILYGKHMTPRDRQEFLERYGCTGWTEEALNAIVTVANDRGIVEMGAGHGQWARALTERYHITPNNNKDASKQFDFVLAFDDMSGLPLNPQLYHSRTKPYHDYFFDNVQKCDNIRTVLQQWQCRGRVLLLVFPPSGTMAEEAIRAYGELEGNDTVVYVGEGRGGANANDGFFDYIESGEWVLLQILPVKPFGDKGYEKLYVLQKTGKFRRRTNQRGCVSSGMMNDIHTQASSLPRESN